MDFGTLPEELFREAAELVMKTGAETDEQVMAIVEDRVLAHVKRATCGEMCILSDRIFGKMRGELGSLSYLLRDEKISEIMVNGPEEIFVERGGTIMRLPDRFDSREDLERVIRRIAASVHREISELNPILDARLSDGSRVSAVLGNVAIGGPSVTIRRFGKDRIGMADMLENRTLPRECAEDLIDLVAAGCNLFVSGGTSSGKTTFLNALSAYIPAEERVIVIEDSLELDFEGTQNIVRLECREANSAGRGKITLRDLIRASLRMRPDRLVVGEVRGEEAADMLQALNTGHSGMSTGHGNSIRGMLRRLEAMYLSGSQIPLDAIRMQIVEAVDVMVHLERFADGRRRVTEVQELCGYADGEYVLNPLYLMDGKLELRSTGRKLRNDIKLRLKGIRNDRLQELPAE